MGKFDKPFIIFVVGPNGSGKSTLINQILSYLQNDNIPYLCPDVVAKELTDISDEFEKMRTSQILVNKIKEEYIAEKKSFILESVGTHSSHIEFLERALKQGYSLAIYFVTINNVEINIERVKKRVLDNEHDVPNDKIISRYYSVMDKLIDYIEVSNCILVIDNSTERYRAAFLKNESGYKVFLNEEYVEKYITSKLDELLIEYIVMNIEEFEKNNDTPSELMDLFLGFN